MEIDQSGNPPPVPRKIIKVEGQRRWTILLRWTIFCVLAAIMNLLFSILIMVYLRFPLFLDTVFTAAIAFAFGIIPGIFVAVLTWLFPCIYHGGFNPFVLCSIAEVLLVCALKPPAVDIPDFAPKEKVIASYIALASRLMLLYIICAITISVLGGLGDFLSKYPVYFSVEDNFKPALIMNNLPGLAVNILSRIPVNIVDRFIVIFGGYFISRGLMKFTK